MSRHMQDNLDIFLCPECQSDVTISDSSVVCSSCRKLYRIKNNIPLMFSSCRDNHTKNDVTDTIKSFYEKTPFPNYDDCDDSARLIEKSNRGIFARLLNEQTPFNIRVLEVGCGTGQLTNFLGLARRFMFGTDMCLNSLSLAEDFRSRNGIERAGFYQMNLFRPIFKEESFPLVICNGVLHHTEDPSGGFRAISRLVKKGGYIIAGLYNKYGRITIDMRRAVFNLFGKKLFFIDPQLKRMDTDDVKKNAWFMDQYKNPHESRHSIGEVMGWFEKSDFDFIGSIPAAKSFGGTLDSEMLFKKCRKPGRLDLFISQSRLVFSGYKEGGFFVMIGRRRF